MPMDLILRPVDRTTSMANLKMNRLARARTQGLSRACPNQSDRVIPNSSTLSLTDSQI